MRIVPIILAAALAALHPGLGAQTPPGYGPGMMGGGPYGPGYGQGMMGGGPYGPGYGPGMMGGSGPYGPGMGPGMMGGGYGPGRAYGPGMMGGGMMGLGPLGALDLSEQQQTKISQIQDEVRRKNWSVMGRLLDEQARMRDLFLADKREPVTVGQQFMKMADLRRQLLEAQVDARNRIEATLTKEQREQLRTWHRRGWVGGDD